MLRNSHLLTFRLVELQRRVDAVACPELAIPRRPSLIPSRPLLGPNQTGVQVLSASPTRGHLGRILPLKASRMLPIPRRHAHFVFGIIQSGLTSAIAAAIASIPFFADGSFLIHWLPSWLISWVMMLPIVLFAAPFIRNISNALTREEGSEEARR